MISNYTNKQFTTMYDKNINNLTTKNIDFSIMNQQQYNFTNLAYMITRGQYNDDI